MELENICYDTNSILSAFIPIVWVLLNVAVSWHNAQNRSISGVWHIVAIGEYIFLLHAASEGTNMVN